MTDGRYEPGFVGKWFAKTPKPLSQEENDLIDDRKNIETLRKARFSYFRTSKHHNVSELGGEGKYAPGIWLNLGFGARMCFYYTSEEKTRVLLDELNKAVGDIFNRIADELETELEQE